jgi:hypothetical protein
MGLVIRRKFEYIMWKDESRECQSFESNNPELSWMFCLFLAQLPLVVQGLLIHEVSRSHTTTQYSRWGSSGRVISSSQRLLPENTKHSQTSMRPVEFEPTISAGVPPRTYAFDCAATGTSCLGLLRIMLRHPSRDNISSEFETLIGRMWGTYVTAPLTCWAIEGRQSSLRTQCFVSPY